MANLNPFVQAPTQTAGVDDYSVQQRQLTQQQAMIDALRKQSMEPGSPTEMVSGWAVKKSPLEGFAKIAQALAGNYMQEKADANQLKLGNDINAKNAADIQGYVDAFRGTAAKPATTYDDGLTMPEGPATQGNPDRALAIAMGSRNPALQQAGLSQIKEMSAGPKWEKAELPNADGTKRTGYVNVNSRDPVSTFQLGGTAPTKNEFVNGQAVNPFTIQTTGKAIPKQLEPDSVVSVGPGGVLVPNAPVISAKAQIAAAGKPSMNTTVINSGPKEFEKELGKLDAEQLGKWRSGAEAANNSLGVVQALRSAEKQGAYSGAAADQKLAAARMVETITGFTPKGQVGSELYNMESKKLVLEHVKALGANPSNTDRDFIEKTVPQLATSAQARALMANFIEKKAAQQIDLYTRADAHARQKHGLGGFEAFDKPPASTVPANLQSEIAAEIARRKAGQ